MRFAALVLLLAATAAYVGLHPPYEPPRGGVLAACPPVLGGWDGSELSFSRPVLDELRADDVLVRRYARGDDVVWLTIVYHRNRRYGAHDPVLCYRSQGYRVEALAPRRVADGSPGGVPVLAFRAVRPDDRRLVYSWWTTRGLSAADPGAVRGRMALDNVLESRSWGALVRIETRVRRGEPAAARSLDDFGARLARRLPGLFAGADRGPRG